MLACPSLEFFRISSISPLQDDAGPAPPGVLVAGCKINNEGTFHSVWQTVTFRHLLNKLWPCPWKCYRFRLHTRICGENDEAESSAAWSCRKGSRSRSHVSREELHWCWNDKRAERSDIPTAWRKRGFAHTSRPALVAAGEKAEANIWWRRRRRVQRTPPPPKHNATSSPHRNWSGAPSPQTFVKQGAFQRSVQRGATQTTTLCIELFR